MGTASTATPISRRLLLPATLDERAAAFVVNTRGLVRKARGCPWNREVSDSNNNLVYVGRQARRSSCRRQRAYSAWRRRAAGMVVPSRSAIRFEV